MKRLILVASFLFVVAQTPAAEAKDRFRLIVNGAFNVTTANFSETRRFTEFVETGTIDVKYKDGSGPGGDVGLRFDFVRHVGVCASYSLVSREGSGSFSAAFPHPLYLNRPREASGDLSGLKYKEKAFHLDVVLHHTKGAFAYAVFAGSTFFTLDQDLIETVRYSHSYPYDSVTISGTPKKAFRDKPVGFNVGGGLDYRLGQSRRFALGAQVRFSSAKAKLAVPGDSVVSLDVGGLHVGGGLRVSF